MYLSAMASIFRGVILAGSGPGRWFSDPSQNFLDFSALMNSAQESPNLGTDFRRMGLQCKMSRVVEDDLGARIITTVGLRPGRQKERIVLSPYRESGRAMRAEVLLKLRIKRQLAFV